MEETRRLSVVVVEDQDDNRELLEMLISMRGHDSVGAADGEEGAELISARQPDVALIDIGLPGIDGFEVARRVRATDQGRALFLVALTGYGRAEDKDRAEEAGFDLHVVKPISKVELFRLLHEAQQRQKNRSEPEVRA